MTTVKTILLIYLVALLSVTLLPKLVIFYALPNVILVLSLLFIFQNEFKRGLLWGLLGGLFLDFLGFGFPSNILLTTVIVLLTWFLVKKYFESSNIYLFLIFCFLANLIYGFFLFPAFHIFVALSSALYSTFLGLIFYLIYLKLQKGLKKELLINYQKQK